MGCRVGVSEKYWPNGANRKGSENYTRCLGWLKTSIKGRAIRTGSKRNQNKCSPSASVTAAMKRSTRLMSGGWRTKGSRFIQLNGFT